MPDGSAVSKKTKAGPISADRLKSFVERIEKLEEERKAIGGDIRDVYSEAKGVGYDVKTMRRIVSLQLETPMISSCLSVTSRKCAAPSPIRARTAPSRSSLQSTTITSPTPKRWRTAVSRSVKVPCHCWRSTDISISVALQFPCSQRA